MLPVRHRMGRRAIIVHFTDPVAPISGGGGRGFLTPHRLAIHGYRKNHGLFGRRTGRIVTEEAISAISNSHGRHFAGKIFPNGRDQEHDK